MPVNRNAISAPEPPRYFKAKKYFLLGVITANLLMIVVAIFSVDIITERAFAEKRGGSTSSTTRSRIKTAEEIERSKSTAKMLLFSGLSFGLILELLFFLGILRESICLSTGYAVVAVLCSVFLAANAFSDPLVGLEAIICALVAIVALLYVLDLARYRQINGRSGGGGGVNGAVAL